MRHFENIHIKKNAKDSSCVRSLSCQYGAGQCNFSPLLRWQSERKSKWIVGKDSHICMTSAEVLLASISAAVAGINGLPHTPSASPGGYWMGEGPNSPTEALHIIPWLRLRWLSFIKEGNRRRAPHCDNRSGGCLLETSNLCFGVFFGWIMWFFFFFPRNANHLQISTFLKMRPWVLNPRVAWQGCPQARLGPQSTATQGGKPFPSCP